jgi:predicted ATPase
VIEAGPVVADLLNSAADLTVLVTSRAPLRIAGEQEYPLTPLELPDPTHELTPERVVRSEAVTLFVNRAQSVRPSFAVTVENARCCRWRSCSSAFRGSLLF